MNEKKYQTTKSIIIAVLIILVILSAAIGTGGRIVRKFSLIKGCGVPLGPTVSDSITVEGSVTSISVDAAVAALNVAYSDELKDSVQVNYTIPESLIPSAKLTNGKLTVKSKGRAMFGDISADGYIIEIILPTGTNIDIAEFATDCGSITLSDFACNDLSIDADCGSIIFKNVTCNIVNIDADLGSIDIKDSSIGKTSVDADCGAIIFTNSVMSTVNCDADLGNIELSDCSFKRGTFDADMGEIAVAGDFDYVNANCDMGSIKVNTNRAENEYELITRVSMGSVYVNGTKR